MQHTISLGDHSNISIKQALLPNTSLLNLGKNSSKAIKSRHWQNLPFPPTPTIQTASSGTFTTYNLSKHLTSQFRQRYHRKQRQPPIYFKSEFLKFGLPLPRTTKKGKPGFRNSSSVLAGSVRTPQPPWLTLENWSRRHQVRLEPLMRTK